MSYLQETLRAARAARELGSGNANGLVYRRLRGVSIHLSSWTFGELEPAEAVTAGFPCLTPINAPAEVCRQPRQVG